MYVDECMSDQNTKILRCLFEYGDKIKVTDPMDFQTPNDDYFYNNIGLKAIQLKKLDMLKLLHEYRNTQP